MLNIGLFTIVGIGNIPGARRVPFPQKPVLPAPGGRGGPVPEFGRILTVHRHEEVEGFVVGGDHHPGPVGELQAVETGARPRPRIGQLAPGSQADMAARANIERLDTGHDR